MKLRNSPFSSLPSQFLGKRSLIRYGLKSVSCLRGYVLECCVDAVQHVHPAIDRLVHFCAQLLYDVSHFLSQLLLEYCEVCCGDHVCLLFLLELPLVLPLPQCCAWPRSCPSVPARGVDHRRSATMSNASLFCGTLEPTRMRWECGQARVTRLRKGSNCAGVQRCQVCAPINTEEDREKERKVEKGKEGKMMKPRDDTVYLRRDTMEALKRSDEKIESYSRKADEKWRDSQEKLTI